MQKSQRKEMIERNFERIRVHPRSTKVREWEKLDPDQIFTLLQNCVIEAKPAANELIAKLSSRRWTLAATAHDAGSTNPDDRLHITIRVRNSRAYHLYCRELKNARGLQITGITMGQS